MHVTSIRDHPSFGFGDRIGKATAGHVRAMRRAGYGLAPVFAQQSIREMERTGRSPERVLADAAAGMRAQGWDGPLFADADHLRTAEHVGRTVGVGFTMFTIDPSGVVAADADHLDEEELAARHRRIADLAPWVERHVGAVVPLAGGEVLRLDRRDCMRCAVKYGAAVRLARELAERVREGCAAVGRAHYDLELSLDETPVPTTPAEHWIIVSELRRAGVALSAVAPRLPGRFEKAIDFEGDLAACERAMADHAAIARELGGYKLSLHSGSDKLSVYPALARATGGRFHVKTAGTSYLEALRVAALRAPELFARIVGFARRRYHEDRATYELSADLGALPAPKDVADPCELVPPYLGEWERVPPGSGFRERGRQVLHCTYGSVLADPDLGPELLALLDDHAALYAELLEEHFTRHLHALGGTVE